MSNPAQRSETSCRQCGNCCRWAGFVRIGPEETDAIARFLALSIEAFTARYTRLHPARSGLALNDAADGACVFLADNRCRIHSVKPRQCRNFPSAWARAELATHCQSFRENQGLNHKGVSSQKSTAD